MEGETSLDEERELGDWLRCHEVDDDLKPYQQMFAAFDEGLPYPSVAAPRRRVVWWHWAAAAVIAGLLVLGGVRLATTMSRPPLAPQEGGGHDVTAKQELPPEGNLRITDEADVKPSVVKTEQVTETHVAQAVPERKKVSKPKVRAQQTPRQDSIEVAHTEGELELAESEYLAEQQELERQLQQLRQQRVARQSGWHYTTLPCE